MRSVGQLSITILKLALISGIVVFPNTLSLAQDYYETASPESEPKPAAVAKSSNGNHAENCRQELGPEAHKTLSCINKHIMSYSVSLGEAQKPGSRAEDCFSTSKTPTQNAATAAMLSNAYSQRLQQINKSLAEKGGDVEKLNDDEKRFLIDFNKNLQAQQQVTNKKWDVVKANGLKFNSVNKEDFSHFDFAKLKTDQNLRTAFEQLYGSKNTKQLIGITSAPSDARRVKAAQIGDTVFYPKYSGDKYKGYQSASTEKYQSLVVEELKNYQKAADELLRYSKEYSSLTGQWSSAMQRIDWTGAAKSLVAKDTLTGFREWKKAMQGSTKNPKSEPEELMDFAEKQLEDSFHQLKYHLGLSGPNLEDLEALQSKLQENVRKHEYQAIENSTKLINASIGAAIAAPAAVIATGSVGVAGAVGIASKLFLVGMGITVGASATEGIVRTVLNSNSQKDFWCNLGEDFTESAASSLDWKGVSMQIGFAGLPFAGGLLEKVRKIKTIGGVAIAGAVGYQSYGIYKQGSTAKQLSDKAEAAEAAGNHEEAEAYRRQARGEVISAVNKGVHMVTPIVARKLSKTPTTKTSTASKISEAEPETVANREVSAAKPDAGNSTGESSSELSHETSGGDDVTGESKVEEQLRKKWNTRVESKPEDLKKMNALGYYDKTKGEIGVQPAELSQLRDGQRPPVVLHEIDHMQLEQKFQRMLEDPKVSQEQLNALRLHNQIEMTSVSDSNPMKYSPSKGYDHLLHASELHTYTAESTHAAVALKKAKTPQELSLAIARALKTVRTEENVVNNVFSYSESALKKIKQGSDVSADIFDASKKNPSLIMVDRATNTRTEIPIVGEARQEWLKTRDALGSTSNIKEKREAMDRFIEMAMPEAERHLQALNAVAREKYLTLRGQVGIGTADELINLQAKLRRLTQENGVTTGVSDFSALKDSIEATANRMQKTRQIDLKYDP